MIGILPSKEGAVKVTDTWPAAYARFVPTSVPVPIVGAFGTDFFEESVVPVF